MNYEITIFEITCKCIIEKEKNFLTMKKFIDEQTNYDVTMLLSSY